MKLNERARTTMLAETEGLSDEHINKRPAEDRWSIKQILEHLYLMEGAIAKIIQKQLEEGERKDISDKPIELTVNREKKVDASDFVIPGDDFATRKELIQKLESSHKLLADTAINADETLLEERMYPHPQFGELSLKQWIPFVAYHEMRHTEQLKEVKHDLNL
ncbi:DinB family protein [Virgibacillus ihumii]|uniref:DinB family protein n=1 Tax=Virgibacillus ihumii TaxID=2686091 RepID=UPI00157DE467|nr:DinB family protein [Virgibacillus ihumii]